MATIEEQIGKISEKDRERLEELLVDVTNDRYWCRMHGIDYVDPNFEKAREEIYKEFFQKKYPQNQ